MIKQILFKEFQVSSKVLLAIAVTLVVIWVSGLYALNKTMAQIAAPPTSTQQWTCTCCRPSVSAAKLPALLVPYAPASACENEYEAQQICQRQQVNDGIYRVADTELMLPGDTASAAAGSIHKGDFGGHGFPPVTNNTGEVTCFIYCEPIETGDRTCKTPPGVKTGTGSGLAAASALCDVALDVADPLPANYTGRRSVQWCGYTGNVVWQCALPQR